jgi:hypothetical protein
MEPEKQSSGPVLIHPLKVCILLLLWMIGVKTYQLLVRQESVSVAMLRCHPVLAVGLISKLCCLGA